MGKTRNPLKPAKRMPVLEKEHSALHLYCRFDPGLWRPVLQKILTWLYQ
jgi:hypothetical protein